MGAVKLLYSSRKLNHGAKLMPGAPPPSKPPLQRAPPWPPVQPLSPGSGILGRCAGTSWGLPAVTVPAGSSAAGWGKAMFCCCVWILTAGIRGGASSGSGFSGCFWKGETKWDDVAGGSVPLMKPGPTLQFRTVPAPRFPLPYYRAQLPYPRGLSRPRSLLQPCWPLFLKTVS